MKSVDLGTGKVSHLFFSLSAPAAMAQIVTVIYNMVDRIYIGQLADSRNMMAAIGIVAPVVLIINAFAALLGTGGAPLCAICLGRKEKDEAERILSNSFGALMISGIILMIATLFFAEPLLAAFGAEGDTLQYALEYLRIYVIGTLFIQTAVGMNNYITTQGHGKMGMITVATGAILNVILDPIFIYGLEMEVAGAALATVISQFVSAVLVLWFLRSRHTLIKLRLRYMWPRADILKRIMALGISPFIMKLTESLISITFNSQLFLYGGDLAVSVMTIMTSVWQLAQLMTHGFTLGAQPILSFNLGAGNLERVRQAFRYSLVSCWVWTALCATAVMLVPQLFLRMFTADLEVLAIGPTMLRVYFVGMFCYGAFNACQQAYLSLGNAKNSLFFAVFRKVVLLIPLVYILPSAFPTYAVLAVLAAEPIADISSTIINGIVFRRYYKKRLGGDSSI